MTTLLSGLGEIVLTFIEVLLAIGFVVALAKVLTTGHYEGCGPLMAIVIAFLVIELWRGGALLSLLQAFIQPLYPGALVAPGC
jgi:hypothetical protein